MTRIIKVESEEIKDLITKKGEIVTKGRELNAQKEEIETELNKAGLQINKLNDKLIPMVHELGIELGEFEQIESIKIEENELVVTIFDQVEEYKAAILKEKEEKKLKEEQAIKDSNIDKEKIQDLLAK